MTHQDTVHLRQERNFVSAILDTVGALIIVVDTQGRIIRFNSTCEQVTGYTFAQVKGKHFWDLFIVPEEMEAVKKSFEQLRDGQYPTEAENQWRAKDGTCHWIAWSNTVLLNQAGNVEYIIGTGINITARKQAEKALSQERNLLRTLIDNLPDYIYVKDVDSRFIIANKAVARIMGAATPAELIGKTDFDFYPRHLAAKFYADEQKVVQSGHSIINQEEKTIDSLGNKKWLLTTKVPVQDNTGNITSLVGLGRDITERKRVEDEKSRLLQEVSQQREQLRALTRQLAETEEAERRLLARELHDQVGPNLTALGLKLNIIQGQLPDTLPVVETIRPHLEDSQALVEQTTELIRNVMADLRPPVLDDYGLVAALRWYGARFAARMNLSITVQGEELDPRPPAAIENALFRIAQEALNNAAKHAHSTQITVTVKADARTIRMTVLDDGVGFEPSHLSEPASRQGWGLLTMAERAEAVGGHCHIEAQPGQGTCITVEITR